jgi:hypothetical protein
MEYGMRSDFALDRRILMQNKPDCCSFIIFSRTCRQRQQEIDHLRPPLFESEWRCKQIDLAVCQRTHVSRPSTIVIHAPDLISSHVPKVCKSAMLVEDLFNVVALFSFPFLVAVQFICLERSLAIL